MIYSKDESSNGHNSIRTCQRFASDGVDLVAVLEVKGEEASDDHVVEQRLQPEVVVEDERVGRGGVLQADILFLKHACSILRL